MGSESGPPQTADQVGSLDSVHYALRATDARRTLEIVFIRTSPAPGRRDQRTGFPQIPRASGRDSELSKIVVLIFAVFPFGALRFLNKVRFSTDFPTVLNSNADDCCRIFLR